MKTPQTERDEIQERVRSLADGMLPIDAVAFRVARSIVKYHDPELLQQVPEDVAAWVRAMVDMYKTEGKVVLYFSTGEADHTEFVRQLIEVLEPPGRP